jgi:alginate O-acetyltransferase complex protein AlgI
MLFNSIEFAIFLPIVFALYWFVANRRLKLQNALIVAASFVFYGWWDWRFLSLLVFSASVDYFVGLALGKEEDIRKRKLLLWISISINLGLLGFFKYYNFFTESFAEAFTFFGQKMDPSSFRIILPIGISFYTFQALSYSIDVYRKKLEPTRDIVAYFAFICFFPQLVAGPIERATHLLPQFYKKRTFDYGQAVDGLRQILWGLFKKIVIADNCAEYVQQVFDNPTAYHGSTLFIGIFLFAIQIYCDFSGYSDIAIGTARLFGFSLMRNFAFPYFSRDIAEFWRRWHISLSTWFRDYLYYPLGGSHGKKSTIVRNIFIVFIVSGFWHGASWTFIIWGFLNALYFLPLLLLNKNRAHLNTVAEDKLLPSLKEFGQMSLTFFLTLIAWVFFRADTLSDAFAYLRKMFSATLFAEPDLVPVRTLIAVSLFLAIEWAQRTKQHGLEFRNLKISRTIRWTLYCAIVFIIFVFGGKEQEFIYFQF